MADKAYTTEAKMAFYLGGITIASGAGASAILAAQGIIEMLTGRNFKADVTASARLYDGNDRQALAIDDCIEVTKVEVGSNVWGDSFTEQVNTGSTPEYYKLPANYASDAVPIRKIGLRSRLFIGGHANHRITAKWGYSLAVPDDVSYAATVIASGIYYQNRGENTGPVKSEKIGEYQVSYANEKGMNDFEQAIAVLEKYKKIEL